MQFPMKSLSRLSRRGIGRMTTALFLGVVLVLNILVYALATRFSWYFYTADKYTHEIGDSMAEKFAAAEHKVAVRFCMTEADLEKNTAYRLVYETAKQYAAAYPDKVELLTPYSIYTDHRAVLAYEEKFRDKGQEVTLSETSVIFESEEDLRHFSLSDFFILNANREITAYNGEEVFAAACLWVQTKSEDHPTAYFTVDHGENFAISGLTTKLVLSGYRVGTVRLSESDVPDDCALLIISNPLYDFEKAGEGSTVKTELSRLESYIDGGGRLYLTFDAANDACRRMTNLRSLLLKYGLSFSDELLYDYENGITRDGKTAAAVYAADGKGASVGETAQKYNAARVVYRDAAPLTLYQDNDKGAAVYPVLFTSDTAETATEGRGKKVLSAMADTAAGGKLYLAASGYMNYDDVINSKNYGNSDLFYALLAEYGCPTAPAGCTVLPIETAALDNLTVGTANRIFILMVAVLPLLLAGTATAVCLYRRKR